MYLVHTKNLPIRHQLELEEAFLRLDNRPLCLINEGTSTPAIVLGISQKPKLVVENTTMPLIRRFSGGGTVVVDENTLFVTFIGNSDELSIPHNPQGIAKWTTKFYGPLFQDLNFTYHENDYRLGNQKIGGNAQYFRKGRFLHHTSFLYDWCPNRMKSLKMPPKMPSYRQMRPHESFLTPLKNHFPSKSALTQNLVNELQKHFTLKNISLNELEQIRLLPHRKSVYQLHVA
jgi:lipoate-protein ligase A